VCPNNTASTQVCDASGTAFSACQCQGAPLVPGAAGNAAAGTAAPPTNAAGTGGTGTGPDLGMQGSPITDPMMGAAGTAGGAGPAMAGMGGMPAPGGAGGSSGMAEGDEGVPAGDHCAAVAQWDPMWVQFEEEVLMLTNAARARGATCGDMGTFEPAGPLVMNAELRCSARLHSMDMGEMGYFAHESQNGDDPFDRMAAAGYSGRLMGENIAKGQQSPSEVVDGWMNSPGHCTNIMNKGFTDIGIGYWQGEAENQWFNGNKLWTQNFGAPLGGGGNGGCQWGPPFC
jgi:uncharacterized protein YkwD